jgi:nucleoside-diphosphate-sugar epimerase
MKSRRVLVTGATGCVGRHALPALVTAGWDVHAIASKQTPIDLAGVTWHHANLLDRDQMQRAVSQAGATHLLHLAWYIAPGRWAAAPENFEWVEASLALLRAFRAAGGARIVTAGSCLEYDWNYGSTEHRPFSESLTPRTPHTVYGTCKNALQALTSAYAASTGMTSAWGRIFFLYGPHEHPDRLVASVIRSLLAGEPAKTSHGNQVRDYLFAGDVADAFVALLGSDVTGPINIASGNAITLKDIITRIGQLIGKPDLIRLGAIPAAPTDTPFVVADTSQLASSLSWRPRYGLDEGLTRTIEWWRAQQTAGRPA